MHSRFPRYYLLSAGPQPLSLLCEHWPPLNMFAIVLSHHLLPVTCPAQCAQQLAIREFGLPWPPPRPVQQRQLPELIQSHHSGAKPATLILEPALRGESRGGWHNLQSKRRSKVAAARCRRSALTLSSSHTRGGERQASRAWSGRRPRPTSVDRPRPPRRRCAGGASPAPRRAGRAPPPWMRTGPRRPRCPPARRRGRAAGRRISPPPPPAHSAGARFLSAARTRAPRGR
mmetsp:Transcript_144916/g.361449  ORF Transcript_144916/g.361449 Transcript_144916/m.361449 type:complete len:230 (-) Transcript_144916:905-1594(-)